MSFNITGQNYSPTLEGADTFSNTSFWYQVTNGIAFIFGYFEASSPNADNAFIGLPSTIVVDPNAISTIRNGVGRMLIYSTSAVAKEYNMMTRLPTFDDGVNAGLITTAATAANAPVAGLDGDYSLWIRVPVVQA